MGGLADSRRGEHGQGVEIGKVLSLFLFISISLGQFGR